LRYVHLFDLSNFLPSRRRDCLTTILRLHQPFQNRTIPCFAPSHLPPLSKVRCCRPKKFGRLPEGLSLHQPFQNRTIPCFAPSHLPPLLKVRCCRPKKFGRLPEGLSFHRPFQNRTIPCFAPSHLPPLSKVRCCRPKKFGRLPEGLSLYQPFQNRTIPCFAPSHLPPLSKVRCCRPKKFGRLPEGLSLHQPFQHRTISLSFRRGGARSSCCTKYCHSHNHCKRTTTPRSSPTLPKPHYPLLCTITLASLVKGRWIDGKAQALILLRSVCDTPTFFYLSNFSAVKTEGLPHHYSSPLTNPLKTALSLALHHHTCLPCQREVD